MKITDMLISALLKKGILYEARNVDVEVKIPNKKEEGKEATDPIIVHFKTDHMSLRLEQSGSKPNDEKRTTALEKPNKSV